MALSVVRKYKQTGLLGLGEAPPRQIHGVRQCVTYETPDTCDKCGSRMMHQDVMEPRRYVCFDCSADCFLVEAPWRIGHARVAATTQ